MRLLLQVAETEDNEGVHHPSRVAQGATTQAAQDAIMLGLQDLERAGFLAQVDERSLADDKWLVTLEGRSAVDEMTRQRDQDSTGRKIACRKAIIAWLARLADSGVEHGDWEDFTEEQGNEWVLAPFPEHVIDRASVWLADRGYLTGHYVAETPRPLLPSITSRGESWHERGAPMTDQSPAGGDHVEDPQATAPSVSESPLTAAERRLHVQLSSGKKLIGSIVASIWDLTEEALRRRVLEPRSAGGFAWFSGTEFSWAETKVVVYEGPPTSHIDNFVAAMGPGLLALSGPLRDVTDRYITGPAGAPSEALGAVDTRTTSASATPVPRESQSPPQSQATGTASGMKRYQVFLSSTFRDLESERQAVTQSLLKMGRCIPAGMELFTASSLPPWQYIQRVLEVTDYVVLVIGDRYGSSPPGGDLSYTELEYNYALQLEIPVIPFIPDEKRLVLRSNLDEDRGARAKLDVFTRRLLDNHHTRTWTDEIDLAGQVKDALNNEFIDNPRPGWIRGS